MMERLFTYGTLQYPEIQQAVVGRMVQGEPDSLAGYSKTQINFGGNDYPIIIEDGNGLVEGHVIEVTPQELVRIDRYETSAYRRVTVKLKSGLEAWVYLK